MAKVEGKGNGVKTVIVNMTAIAKALQRPPSYPCKYFGCELGAQTQMDPKADRYIVNGAHEGPRLQELLDGFIRSFVLCEECENPETELTVQSSKNKIYQKCIACGHGRYIPPQHKLTTFIIKNPPNSSEDSNSNKKDKKGGKKSKGKKEKEPASPIDSQPPHSDDPDTITTHQNGAATGAKNGLDDDDDEDWSVDTSKAAVKARMEKLSDGANALTLNDDLEKTNTERLNMFFKFVEAIKKQGGVPAIAQNLVKIKSEAERLEVMETAAGIMAELLYTEALLSEVKQFRPLMLHFVHDNPKAQKTLLDAFEIIVGKVYPAALMSKAPLILKSFYDEDLLEEEPIIEWYNKVCVIRVKIESYKWFTTTKTVS
jgi:translation initiation factor 5